MRALILFALVYAKSEEQYFAESADMQERGQSVTGMRNQVLAENNVVESLTDTDEEGGFPVVPAVIAFVFCCICVCVIVKCQKKKAKKNADAESKKSGSTASSASKEDPKKPKKKKVTGKCLCIVCCVCIVLAGAMFAIMNMMDSGEAATGDGSAGGDMSIMSILGMDGESEAMFDMSTVILPLIVGACCCLCCCLCIFICCRKCCGMCCKKKKAPKKDDHDPKDPKDVKGSADKKKKKTTPDNKQVTLKCCMVLICFAIMLVLGLIAIDKLISDENGNGGLIDVMSNMPGLGESIASLDEMKPGGALEAVVGESGAVFVVILPMAMVIILMCVCMRCFCPKAYSVCCLFVCLLSLMLVLLMCYDAAQSYQGEDTTGGLLSLPGVEGVVSAIPGVENAPGVSYIVAAVGMTFICCCLLFCFKTVFRKCLFPHLMKKQKEREAKKKAEHEASHSSSGSEASSSVEKEKEPTDDVSKETMKEAVEAAKVAEKFQVEAAEETGKPVETAEETAPKVEAPKPEEPVKPTVEEPVKPTVEEPEADTEVEAPAAPATFTNSREKNLKVTETAESFTVAMTFK